MDVCVSMTSHRRPSSAVSLMFMSLGVVACGASRPSGRVRHLGRMPAVGAVRRRLRAPARPDAGGGLGESVLEAVAAVQAGRAHARGLRGGSASARGARRRRRETEDRAPAERSHDLSRDDRQLGGRAKGSFLVQQRREGLRPRAHRRRRRDAREREGDRAMSPLGRVPGAAQRRRSTTPSATAPGTELASAPHRSTPEPHVEAATRPRALTPNQAART